MKVLNYIILLLLFNFSYANAQKEMFMEHLADKLVIRKKFDENGNLLNKQTFRVGNLIKTQDYHELKVATELFDKNGKFEDKYITTYRCKPGESKVIIMALPFTNPKSKETKISTTSKNFKKLYNLNNLKNIELEMSFDSGLLNFFGSKSKIIIYDRDLQSTGKGSLIKSKINIKAYALGIRIKRLHYTVKEKLNPNGFLTYQKFTENDGSYFTITYKKTADQHD